MKVNTDGLVSRLLDARDALSTSGWTKGTYSNTIGERCLIGALDVAPYDEYEMEMAMDIVRVLINNQSIDDWNDDPKRKKQQVIDILNQAASLAMSNKELF